MYEYWCDLEVVVLHIIAEYELQEKMLVFTKNCPKNTDDIVTVYLHQYCNLNSFPYKAVTYREKQMNEKGFYIGHFFGSRTAFKILGENEIHICTEDYNRILWSYVVKVILTVKCLDKGYLHLKAASVVYADKTILVAGRGGSGKTELIKYMSECGAKVITNTHLIVDNGSAMGIKTNIRLRDEAGQDYYVSPDQCFCNTLYDKNKKKIDYVIWNQFDKNGGDDIALADRNIMCSLMKQFSEAIANWELHEDVFDWYQQDPIVIGEKLIENEKRLKSLIENTENYFFHVDVFSDKGKNKVREFLDRLL